VRYTWGMVKGRFEGYRELLHILGRAAGLSGLALATLASGPCGDCDAGDECASIDELLATRAEGLAALPDASGGGGGAGGEPATPPSQTQLDVEQATAWDAKACPTATQYSAIVRLKFPQRYLYSSVTPKDLGNGSCCYHVAEDCPGGRPFLVGGQARLTGVSGHRGSDAQAPIEWLADAQAEHASVAAFARLSLQLMALGAPSELVRDAQLASLDELRHAELFFELASRVAGSSLRPGPIDVTGALDDLSLAGLIESNLREGCIGETLAAEELKHRAALVDEPWLREALLRVAADETRHAELAFRILAWCRDVAPELTRRIVRDVTRAVEPSQRRHQAWSSVLSPLLGAVATA
jgi:hypothetical protein